MLRHAAILSTLVVLVAAFTVQAQEEPSEKSKGTEIHKAVAALQEAFNRGDAKGLAACWTTDGEFVGPNSEQIDGRKKIEAAFVDFFAKHPKAKIQLSGVSWRPVASDVALVDLIAVMTPVPEGLEAEPNSTILLVKQDGRWLIGRMHEAVSSEPSHQIHLKNLNWMVGDWAEEGTRASGVSVRSSCDWTTNGSYLIRKFTAEGTSGVVRAGTEVIGWDPRTHRIRSWIFDADGSFGESVWTHDGARWIIKHTGTLADGNDVSVTYIVTPVGADAVTIQSKDHMVGGEKKPDLPEIKFKRRVAQDEAKPKPSESPNPLQHVLP